MAVKKVAKKKIENSEPESNATQSVANDPIPAVSVADVDTSALDNDELKKPEAPKKAPIPEVRVSAVEESEQVQFVLNVDMAPPPKIGRFDFEREMRISVLKKGRYTLPRDVGEVLQDRKYGTIVG